MPEEYKRYTMRDLLKAFQEAGYPVSYMYLKRLEYKGNLILPKSTTNFKKAAGNRPSGAVREMTKKQIDEVVKAFLPGGIGYYDYRKENTKVLENVELSKMEILRRLKIIHEHLGDVIKMIEDS